MVLRALGLVIAAILCMGVIGLGLDFLRLFGLNIQEHGLSVPALLIMIGVAYVASNGRTGQLEILPEMIKVFAFLAALILAASIGNWIVLLVLFAAYVALYAKPFLSGWNYLFVRRPLEQQALKQRTLSAKLDADTELVEATLRHERAKAALDDAERAVAEMERRVRPNSL
jgi:hypothetical protein